MTRERNSGARATALDDGDMLNLVQQERITRHLGALVEQAEDEARAEREEERAESRAQHDQLMIAMHEFVSAARTLAEENRNLRERMDQLHSEVRTLRSAILLAHNVGRENGSQTPLGLDVVHTPDPFGSELFSIPSQSSNGSGKTKKKRNMSAEARARISAAQKARWAPVAASDSGKRRDARFDATLRIMSQGVLPCRTLRNLVPHGRPLWGGRVILLEAPFWFATQQIRQTARSVLHQDRVYREADMLCAQVKSWERTLEQVSFRCGGWIIIQRQLVQSLVEELCATQDTNMSEQNTLCQPLRDVIAQGKPLWGGQLALNEAAFTAAAAQIKQTVRPAIQGVGKGAQQGTILMTKVGTLENFVATKGSGRMLGRVVVKKAEFEKLVEGICTTLQALEEFLPTSKS